MSSTLADTHPVIEKAEELANQGNFTGAVKLLERARAQNVSTETQRTLDWEIARLDMIERDYRHSREEILNTLRKRIPDFRDEEMSLWERQGRFDARAIDGVQRYLGPSVSNLLFRYPDMRERVPSHGDPICERLAIEARNVSSLSAVPGVGLVSPRRFHVRMKVTPDTMAVPESGVVRCWLPYPRAFPFQTDIDLLRAHPEPSWVSQPESGQRTIYFEIPVKASGNSDVSFEIEYAFTGYARSSRIDSSRVTAEIPASARAWIGEDEPHVVFTERMRGLADEISGAETNPAVVARRIYDWCVENLKYSFAPEYATLRNISDWVYEHRYGDCGQKALFYITLCRIKGIPARWQSGWMLFPEHVGLHDWCEVYLDPYGWVPVDVSLAVSAYDSRHLDQPSKNSVIEFLFGSMDHWRMAANAEHSVHHSPPKTSWRTDSVDSQRGELQANDKTIPFHRFSYQLEVLDSELVD